MTPRERNARAMLLRRREEWYWARLHLTTPTVATAEKRYDRALSALLQEVREEERSRAQLERTHAD